MQIEEKSTKTETKNRTCYFYGRKEPAGMKFSCRADEETGWDPVTSRQAEKAFSGPRTIRSCRDSQHGALQAIYAAVRVKKKLALYAGRGNVFRHRKRTG